MIPSVDSFDTWNSAKLVLEFCAVFIGWHSSVYYRHSSSCRLNARKSWVVLSEYKKKEREWFLVVCAHLPYCLPFGQGRTIPMNISNSYVVFLVFLVFQTRCEFHMVFGVVRHELLRSMGWTSVQLLSHKVFQWNIVAFLERMDERQDHLSQDNLWVDIRIWDPPYIELH